ncbi:MarR family winged helix-turn-helix transcriptional regulator [Paenibacillus sp. DMB20]|uniref:MarR family winged helix-turn-helix transcriptional regulator n=1 Tax=Paenibacillus sp. DMB20 TaxID=1642570 RepID=UPI001F34733F|nr:MarR family transcriptional regulator [Paenibacillus sp. DMB20]
MKKHLFSDSVGFRLGCTYRRASNLFANKLKSFDITPEQWSMLSRISENEGLKQKEVAARADKDQPTTTRILDLLEKKGLIRREISPNDRRAFLLRMTEAGHELLASTSEIEKECGRLITEGIDPKEMEIFWDIISRMNANIERN